MIIINKVILMGRLTKDPDVTNGNTTVARFSLAVDRKYKQDGGQTADFINIVTFGKSAEFCEKYLKKGTKIVLTGRIQSGSYKNKDGQTIYTTDVVAEEIEFAESKSAQSGNGFNQIDAPIVNEELPVVNGGFKPVQTDMPFNIPQGVDDELPFAPVSR